MKFRLTEYQVDAATDIVENIHEGANRFEHSGRLSAISLAAATGAGKTVIATAVIEKLLYGDEILAPNPRLTVIWVTDDPSLNQQTRRKMLIASSQIKAGQLVVVDASLDQKALDPGKIYFIHIQQLGKGATNYVKTGDRRTWSIWDTIGNTIREQGGNCLLVIDEAHKGTGAKNGGGKTITAQLIDGAGGNLPPTPVVLGISATPGRFVDAITKAGHRTLETVSVDANAVRESGLIKDKIRIKHPTTTHPGDSTLLEMAVRDLRFAHELWEKYTKEQGEPPVIPALVIQIKAKASETELKEILDTLFKAWNELEGKAIGHAFQEHTTLNLGRHTIRYIAPQDIQDDTSLRVVLFKEALTTGWDCPRAEVMLSFRAANDYTYIAQLIGRMVRAPLARRITTDEMLNTVALYLPYYDEKQVAQVVGAIQSDENSIASNVEVNSVTGSVNPTVPATVWQLIAELPSYTRPSKNHRSEVARLNALAALLVGNMLKEDAIEVARHHLTDTLAREATRLSSVLTSKAKEFEQLRYQIQSIHLGNGTVEKETRTVTLNARNIEDLFDRAKRIMGDSAAKWYWDSLCDAGVDPDEAKVRVCVLADDPAVVPALEIASRSLLDAWRKSYNSAINKLPDAKRNAFYMIWQQAKMPQQISMIMPEHITTINKETVYLKHLYALEGGLFPATLTGWEADVLNAELDADSLVAWYRNPTGGAAALAIPYRESENSRTLYPDFLFFHKIDGQVVVDLVDPHNPGAADAGPKWLGLARYANLHGDHFRRVLAVIKSPSEQLISLDLKNPDVATYLETASNETDIRHLFEEYGGYY